MEKNINIQEVIAIPFLHVLKEHPDWIKQYYSLFEESAENDGHSSNSITILDRFITYLRNIFFDNKIVGTDFNIDIDFIIVSHITNIDQCSKDFDEYFGSLSSYLEHEKKIKTITLLINHTELSSAAISKLLSKKTLTLVIPKSLGFFGEVGLFFKQIFKTKFQQLRININDELERKIINNAFSSKFSLSALTPIRIGRYIESIARITKARYIFTTFEGHSRERMIFSHARKGNYKIKCLAYQHSLISKYQHAIKRSINELYDPDYIYTCGISTFEMLKKAPISNYSEIRVLGSPKSLSQEKVFTNSDRLSFLFLPEGMYSEYFLFYKFFNSCSKIYKDFDFIWRSHPLLDLKELDFYNKNDFSKPNTFLSNNKFEDDINTSSHAFYRGSTAIISASAKGVIPIYLSSAKEFDIDILFPINHLIINNPIDIENIVLKSSLNKNKTIVKFCNEYFTPLNFSNIEI